MTYYDREADIVYVGLRDSEVARSQEHGWGLIDLDRDGEPVGMEYWDASAHLAAEFLDALPEPAALEHQPA
ncbi:MAG: DUF2283 domain-containing protein [Pseudonocardiaceae bacterium]